MSQTKWTPGPWENHNGYLIRKIDGDMAFPIAELRVPYRRGVGIVRGHHEEAANATLIASAPDLAEALRETDAALARLEAIHASGFDPEVADATRPTWLDAVHTKARAALRKAGVS